MEQAVIQKQADDFVATLMHEGQQVSNIKSSIKQQTQYVRDTQIIKQELEYVEWLKNLKQLLISMQK